MNIVYPVFTTVTDRRGHTTYDLTEIFETPDLARDFIRHWFETVHSMHFDLGTKAKPHELPEQIEDGTIYSVVTRDGKTTGVKYCLWQLRDKIPGYVLGED